jgi:hypothetical protein
MAAHEQLDVNKLWKVVEECLGGLCDAWNGKRLIPLLEGDLAGYIYRLLVSRFGGDASQLHLSTRLDQGEKNKQFDLVIGRVLTTEDRKRVLLDRAGEQVSDKLKRFAGRKGSLSHFRPAKEAALVLEFKAFPVGFTPSQHRVHLRETLKDIGKLKRVAGASP